MIRAVIAEDERKAARYLKTLLEASGKIEVIGEAANGLACLKVIEDTSPDALFLDIQMPGLSGIEVAETALDSEPPPLIVFITGYHEYAVQAFELAALDYVVKPFDEARITQTIERVERALAQKTPSLDALRAVVAQLARQQPQSAPRKLPVKDYDEGTIRLINPATVICAERIERRVVLRTLDKDFPTYYTVDRLEERLAPEGFIRANAGALFNLNYVDHVIPNGDGSYDVVMKDKRRTILTVSRSRAKGLAELLKL